ncbi:MAG: CHAT domain-containing protein [Alphaproteobacteria bacterium]|nr:CHAT domain-containing protein [Alphaproteobacteria bacterium]
MGAPITRKRCHGGLPSRRRRAPRVLLVAPAAAQTDELPLVAPPRTIRDITAILDQERPDPERMARRLASVEAPEPAGLAGAERAKFLIGRAQAAFAIGRMAQAITDARAAVAQGRGQIPPGDLAVGFNLLAFYEHLGRNHRAAIAAAREAIAVAPQGRPGIHLYAHAYLAAAHGALGETPAAEAALAEGRAILARIEASGRAEPGPVAEMASRLAIAEAEIAEGRGDYRRADAAYKRIAARLRGAIAAAGDERVRWNLNFRLTQAFAGTGRIAYRDGRLVESEIATRAALLRVLRDAGKMNDEAARLIHQLATVVLSQGRFEDAEKLWRAALAIYADIRHPANSNDRAETVVGLATALIFRGRYRDSLALLEELRAALAADPARFDWIAGTSSMTYAASLFQSGRGREAIPVSDRTIERVRNEYGERSLRLALERGSRAVILAGTGQPARALDDFLASVPRLIDGVRANDEEVRGQRNAQLRYVINNYVGFLGRNKDSAFVTGRGIDVAAETFRAVDALRAATVHRAIVASAARALDPEFAELLRREQDGAKQKAALEVMLSELLSLPTGERAPGAVEDARRLFAAIERDRAEARNQIRTRFPHAARIVNPTIATVEEVQAALAADEAMVVAHSLGARTLVWVVRRDRPAVIANVEVGSPAMAEKIERLRRSLDPRAASIEAVPDFDVALAAELYGILLAPVEAAWSDARRLVVVTEGALASLPWSLLVTQPIAQPARAAPRFAEYSAVPFLARRVAITHVPSASAFVTQRATDARTRATKPLLGIGDPWFNKDQAGAGRGAGTMRGTERMRAGPFRPTLAGRDLDSASLAQLPALPETDAEVRTVARLLGAAEEDAVLTGPRASLGALRRADVASRRVLLFATHGLVPGDIDSLDQPALALSAPAVTGEEGTGLLTLADVFALRLDADWVIRSACNTASADGSAAEAVSGLGRAFLYAGARGVLVSHWPVETGATQALTTEIFRRQAADPAATRAEALRRAMVSLIEGGAGRSGFSYAHPIFWAPFTLVGDGR